MGVGVGGEHPVGSVEARVSTECSVFGVWKLQFQPWFPPLFLLDVAADEGIALPKASKPTILHRVGLWNLVSS